MNRFCAIGADVREMDDGIAITVDNVTDPIAAADLERLEPVYLMIGPVTR